MAVDVDRMAVDLVGHDLRIKFAASDSQRLQELITRSRKGKVRQRFNVELLENSPYSHHVIVDLRRAIEGRAEDDRTLDLVLVGSPAAGAGERTWRRRLSPAPITERPGRELSVDVDGVRVVLEVGDAGTFVLVVQEEVRPARPELLAVAFTTKRSQVTAEWSATGWRAIHKAELWFRDPRSGATTAVPLAVRWDDAGTRTAEGQLVQKVVGAADLALVDEVMPAATDEVQLGLVLTDEHGKTYQFAVRLPEGQKSKSLRSLTVCTDDHATIFVPYLTGKGARVKLRLDRFERQDFRYLRRLLRVGLLMRLVRRFRGVWLVGELPGQARGNGYHFFKWVREHHPSRRIYYVIGCDSPDRDRVEELGNFVVRGSRRHIRYSLLATRLIFTHRPQDVLPTHDRRMLRSANGRRVFLQHGILGMRNVAAEYGRRGTDFRVDRIHVGSAREREMIVNDLGHLAAQVQVTGRPLWDALLAPGATPRGVLIHPAERKWLSDPELIPDSEFVQQWRAVLHSGQIAALVAGGLPVTFVRPESLARHPDVIDVPTGVTVLRRGEVDAAALLRDHQLLVTDYSSLGFDFALQGRPVLYFQFDRDRYVVKRPHLDALRDLPGHVTTHRDEFLGQIAAAHDRGFEVAESQERQIAVWADRRDRDNNARVYRSVRAIRGPRVAWCRLRGSAAAEECFEWFRKSWLYRPAMRTVLAVARLTPRSPTVVFESGNGRHYGGNPRAVYEELVRRGTDLRIVWSTTSTFRPADLATKKVRPKSPRFYWEFGRARYWVTDQNLGVDLRPAKRTFYLQTWHGTPLKRMQHDAVSHVGRKDGYLERVSRQTGYWSSLLSPSNYATTCFRSAFRYDGDVLQLGYPRNDVLASPVATAEAAGRMRAELGIPADQRVVLYAPTFRDNVKHQKARVDAGISLGRVAHEMPDGMVLLLRAHHVAGRSIQVPASLRGRVIDVTRYDDSQDLLAVADVLITDYSSMMFDFALTGSPLLFYCPDLEYYRDEARGFYLDFEAEAPGPILRTEQQLLAALHDVDRVAELHRDAVAEFARRYGPMDDGHAAARVVDGLLAR